MKKSEAAVAIAKDVLKHIKSYRKIGNSGYVKGILPKQLIKQGGSLQPNIEKVIKKCGVCALGACFLSYIKLFNKVELSDFENEEDYVNGRCIYLEREGILDQKLRKVFSEKQMVLIESAFELTDMTDFFSQDIPFEKIVDEAIQFGSQYGKHSDRLRAIMLNIIKNKGKFVPSVKLMSLKVK